MSLLLQLSDPHFGTERPRVAEALRAFAERKALYIATHYNHAREITLTSTEAIKRLRLCGATINNQAVLLRGVNDEAATLEALFRALGGDSACEATLRRYEDRLGRALASVINILDPQVIVLGGGLSNMQRLYHHLPTCCAPYVFSDAFDTRFLPPVHGDSSGVRGAAWLWD